jgi:hypothetical protein
VLSTGGFEGMSAEDLPSLRGQLDGRRSRSGIARRSEVGAVIGEDSMDLIRDDLDQLLQEVRRRPPGGLLDQPGKGELGSAIHGDEEVELSFLGADLGEIG